MKRTAATPLITRYLQLERRHLVYLKFILEAYEGLGTLSSVDNRAGIVSLTYGTDVEADVEGLIAALGNEIAIREIPPDSPALPQAPAPGGSRDARTT